jgi:hypothetical protein
MEVLMDLNSPLAYVACGALVVVYAWGRFNTPSSNRSSTRRALYRWSCAGYILTALVLFAVLGILLQTAELRTVLLGEADSPSLPAPLIATLAMTTLLPAVPVLKRVDEWILAAFLDWGAIPAEVKRRGETMRPRNFSVTNEDVARLHESYGDGSYGDTLATHLRMAGSDGLELSQYRLTLVVKLHDRLHSLAGERRYAQFFAEAADEFAELNRRTSDFLRRSDAALTLAARFRELEGQSAYEELMHDRREAFAEGCREAFRALALFLARAILRSEATEREIVRRLRDVGFTAAEPISEPDFPINSLTLLALGVFAYLAVLTLYFSHRADLSQPQTGNLVMAFKIAMVRLVTIGVAVWLMQRLVFFRRAPGDPPKYFAYVLCGMITSAVAAGVCVPFALVGDGGLASGMQGSLPLIALSGVLCSALAFCCDDWPEDTAPPSWLRLVEAFGCGAVMAIGTSFIYFGGLLPPAMSAIRGSMAVAWIVLPSIMALMIGGFVPHIYRSARHAAVARRDATLRVGVSQALA